MIIVMPEDAYALGYCRKGMRAFAARHDLDYRKFLEEGAPVSMFESFDDEMVKAIVRQAKDRVARHGV